MKEQYLDFDEYIQQREPDELERHDAWRVAIGLQAVDGLETSEYLKETAQRNIIGDITIDEAHDLIKQYYVTKKAHDAGDDDKEEADRVSSNIVKVLTSRTFDFSTGGSLSDDGSTIEPIGDASAEPIEDIGIKSRVVDEDAGFEVFVPDSDSDSIDVDAIKADSIHKFKKSLNLDDILDDGSEDEMSSNVENSDEDNN